MSGLLPSWPEDIPPRMLRGGRSAVAVDDGERVYLRVPALEWGIAPASQMPFPEFSVNRSGLDGQASDVLIAPPTREDRHAYQRYGVIAMEVAAVRAVGEGPIALDVRHEPEDWNFYHCHVTSSVGSELAEPSKAARKSIRIKLWRASLPVINPRATHSET